MCPGLHGVGGALLGSPGGRRRRLNARVSSADAKRIRELKQENRELKRANTILNHAVRFFDPDPPERVRFKLYHCVGDEQRCHGEPHGRAIEVERMPFRHNNVGESRRMRRPGRVTAT